jgi:hypothetical protein
MSVYRLTQISLIQTDPKLEIDFFFFIYFFINYESNMNLTLRKQEILNQTKAYHEDNEY